MSGAALSLLDTVRSVLFTPGDRAERFAKATACGADAVILDWEDGVAPLGREQARSASLRFVADGSHRVPVGLRLNRIHTRDGLLDLLALVDSGARPAFLALPKIESAAEVDIVTAHLAAAGGTVPQLVPFIESARGLDHASEIASAAGVAALAFGGVDFSADIGAEFEWEALLLARSRIVQAAATAHVAVWDVPFLATQDEAGLTHETQRCAALGFTGKMAIHPAQAAVINRAFAPEPDKLELARRIVAAEREAAGGPCIVAGKMVDLPVVKLAHRVLDRHARTSVAGIGGEGAGDE